jgi:hypothetical protein
MRGVALAHINAIRKIVEARRHDPFFKRRYERNVENPPSQFSKDEFWRWMIVCMCTSVQRSGPNSRVSKFVRETPFPLRLSVCQTQKNLRQFSENVLRSRGLRFGPRISKQIENNMDWLSNGGWKLVQERFNSLANVASKSSPEQRIAEERKTARLVMGRYGGLAGFGPKQARNLWQCIGVTQYEIPLDSRVCDWVNALPSSFGIQPKKLYGSVAYYEAKMSEIQSLCLAAGVLPCEFDAAVFSAADNDPWPEDDNVF